MHLTSRNQTGGAEMKLLKLKSRKKEKSFEALLTSKLDSLYRIALSYLKNKEKASDAVQDAAFTAYRNFDSLKDKNKFNSWISAILINRCREILRRENLICFEEFNHNTLDTLNYNKSYSNEYSKLEINLDITAALSHIDKKYQEVILLKYFGDLTIKEISQTLNIPEGTVKSRLNFGIKRLKTLISREVYSNEL